MPARPYETERTRRFRESEISEFNRQKINDIEEFGCQVLSVARRTADPPGFQGFSYTIGIYDTCGQPEVVAVGLPISTAQWLLNKAAARLRQGLDLSQGRHGGMLDNVECEFRPVQQKWIRQLLHGSNWYYRDTDYPVLQAVYPDLENRFPEDPNFDRAFTQPLLQPGAAFTEVEREFWSSAE